MKKLLLPVLFTMLCILNVNAQEKEKNTGFSNGDVYVSGAFNYISTSTEEYGYEDDTSSFTLAPSVGYFVKDDLALECSLIYSYSDGRYYTGEKIRTTVFGVSIGAVHFFTPTNKFSFTTGISFSYLVSKDKFEYQINDSDTINIFEATIAPGINYFISNSFALKASIGAVSYSSTTYDRYEGSTTDRFSLNLNLSRINIGLTYKF